MTIRQMRTPEEFVDYAGELATENDVREYNITYCDYQRALDEFEHCVWLLRSMNAKIGQKKFEEENKKHLTEKPDWFRRGDLECQSK